MSRHIKHAIYFILCTITTLSLVACGGGGSSSTGASGSSPFSSSLVVEINDGSQISSAGSVLNQSSSLAGVLSNFLISRAYAGTAGIQIYIDGEATAITDESGTAVIPIQPGNYTVCIGDLALCMPVSVEPDSVVVVNGDDMSTTVERAQDHIVEFQDLDYAHKTLVCHKGKQTISVGTPAAQKGHYSHGDSLGACAGETRQTKAEDDGDEDSNKGKGKNKG